MSIDYIEEIGHITLEKSELGKKLSDQILRNSKKNISKVQPEQSINLEDFHPKNYPCESIKNGSARELNGQIYCPFEKCSKGGKNSNRLFISQFGGRFYVCYNYKNETM